MFLQPCPSCPSGSAIHTHFPWLMQHTSRPFIPGLWFDPTGPRRSAFGTHALWLLNLSPAKRMRWTPLERETELKCCSICICALQQNPGPAGTFQETPTGGPATPRSLYAHESYHSLFLP